MEFCGMKREIDRKCLNHARVHANAQSFDRCEPWPPTGRDIARKLVVSKQRQNIADLLAVWLNELRYI